MSAIYVPLSHSNVSQRLVERQVDGTKNKSGSHFCEPPLSNYPKDSSGFAPVRFLPKAGADLGEGLVNLGAQEGQYKNYDDCYEHENKCVLNQTLAFPLQFVELVAH